MFSGRYIYKEFVCPELARAGRRRRAIDDGLGAASYSVQSLDRAGMLKPVRTSCEGCHFPNVVCRAVRR
jgi:hypothetical protein